MKMLNLDIIQFVASFRNESDRACAILGRVLLDDLLKQIFELVFVKDTPKKDRKELLEGHGPLATFSARIGLAHSLGLITKREADDLHLVRKIANDFAHQVDHSLNFGVEEIRARIFTLSFVRGLVDNAQIGAGLGKLSQEELDDMKSNPRRRFEIGVGILYFHLESRRQQAP